MAIRPKNLGPPLPMSLRIRQGQSNRPVLFCQGVFDSAMAFFRATHILYEAQNSVFLSVGWLGCEVNGFRGEIEHKKVCTWHTQAGMVQDGADFYDTPSITVLVLR
jgi:hypothetical protein